MTSWKDLRTVAGPANRVPEQVRGLSSGDLPARDAAAKVLSETLVREGVTSPAAAPALDLLLAVVEGLDVGAHRAAWIVGDIFAAGHLCSLAGREPVSSSDRRAVLTRASSAKTALVAALSSEDASWRAAAAFALAFVPNVEPDPLRTAALREPQDDLDRGAQASAIFALGVLARSSVAARAALASPSEEPFARSVSAIARAIAGEAVSDEALASGWVSYWLAALPQEVVPWGRHAPMAAFIESVIGAETKRAALAPALAESLVRAPRGAFDARRPAIAKIVVGFSGLARRYADGRVASPTELTPLELRVAEALSEDPRVGVIEQGLPGNARAIRRWLGKLPPGPLEASGSTGRPRWVEAREAIGRGASFDEILDASLQGLGPAERLDLLTELLRGAYRIVSDGNGYISAEALSLAAAQAGDRAIDWAQRVVHDVNELPDGIRDYEALQAFADDHLGVALLVLVRAKAPIEKGTARLVSLSSPDAREILAALPPDEVRQTAFAEWRSLSPENAGARGSFVADVAPLFDLVGSRPLARELLAALEEPMIKARGFSPELRTTLERAAAEGPLLASGTASAS